MKVGDIVAILTKGTTYATDRKFVPNRLAKVVKVTPKRIYTGSAYFFDHEGVGLALARGDKLSADREHVETLEKAAEQRRIELTEKERFKKERDERPTYMLACNIVRWDSDATIADLELLGEAYLQKIIDDIAKAKNAN